MASTIKQVAKRAGVSSSTVSHVLNGTHFVSPELTERILKVVEELDFQPNHMARSLAKGQADMFALIVRDISNPFFSEVARSVQQAAHKHGYDVLLYNTDTPTGEGVSEDANFLTAINKWPFAGLIICQDTFLDAAKLDQLSKKVPIVMISPVLHEHIDAVYIDDELAAFDAVTHFIEAGHRRIAHIAGSNTMQTGVARLLGYLKALQNKGVPVEEALIRQGNFTLEGGRQAARDLLSLRTPPTAIFAANDVMAFGCLKVALEQGYQVPQDVAIMGFDNIGGLTIPALSTVDHGQSEMGRVAVELLLDHLSDNPPIERRTVIIPHKLVIRDTTT